MSEIIIPDIKVANSKDARGIFDILKENLIYVDGASAQNRERGFLVNDFTIEEIQSLVENPRDNIVLAAKHNDLIMGYLTSSKLSKSEQSFQDVVSNHIPMIQNWSDKVIYHRQIAVKPGVRNIARSLLPKFINYAREQGYCHVVCKITHKPFNNERSILLHQKFGFELIDVESKGKFEAGIYLCDLSKSV